MNLLIDNERRYLMNLIQSHKNENEHDAKYYRKILNIKQ